jgi:restriction system protein
MSYKELKSYQQTVIIYDYTVEFCDLYVDKPHKSYRTNMTYRSRMADQMIQAARSGKQNIVEGSAQNDKKGELKLGKIARGSLEELLEDYEDFLRQRGLSLWGKDSVEAREVRGLVYDPYRSYKTYKIYMKSPDLAANVAICLINQTNYLLNQQIRKLEEKSEENFKKREIQKQKKEKDDFKEWLEKEGKIYTKVGVIDKKEAKRKGLESILEE